MLSAVVNSSQIAEAMSTREAKRHTQALVKLSTLVTAICKELLACGDKIVDKSSAEEAARKELFNAIVPMLLRCTESAEHDVSQVLKGCRVLGFRVLFRCCSDALNLLSMIVSQESPPKPYTLQPTP